MVAAEEVRFQEVGLEDLHKADAEVGPLDLRTNFACTRAWMKMRRQQMAIAAGRVRDKYSTYNSR